MQGEIVSQEKRYTNIR